MKRKQALVYKEYQNALKQNNALDFDDLLVKTVELFKLDKEVLDYYQSASDISWWMSIRTQTPCSLSLSGFLP